MSSRSSVMFWFLLLILLNNLMNLCIFCINIDIDEVLPLDINKGPRVNSFRVISVCYSASYLANNFRNLFIYFTYIARYAK